MANNIVLLTADDDGQYVHDHVRHFFDTVCYNTILSLTQEEREEFFAMITEHQSLIENIFGDGVKNAIGFLPISTVKSDRVDDTLAQQYKEWFNKK